MMLSWPGEVERRREERRKCGLRPHDAYAAGVQAEHKMGLVGGLYLLFLPWKDGWLDSFDCRIDDYLKTSSFFLGVSLLCRRSKEMPL
jgi:hypothetical protein